MAGWTSRCTLCQVRTSWQITLAARTDNRLFFCSQTRSSQAFFSPPSLFCIFSPGLGQLICRHLSRQPKEFVYELCTKPVSKWIEYSRGRVAGDSARERINWLFRLETSKTFLIYFVSPGLYPQWVEIWAGNPGRDSLWGWWSPWRGDMEIGARIGAITPD